VIPSDKNGKPILPHAEVRLVGKVERVSREGIAVLVRQGLSVYVPPESLEVVE